MTTRAGPPASDVPERYTLGYSNAALRFLLRRTLASHGAFFSSRLESGMTVLDCGCGPGGITLGIARRISPGRVVAIDRDAGQIEFARRSAEEEGVDNAEFREASIYDLPFADATFDAVFSHALFEHLSRPVEAARECRRVLRPGGLIGIATPDWEAFIVAPDTPARRAALDAYCAGQRRNGGDPGIGRKLATVLTEAGFVDARMSARFENYDPLAAICEVMADQFERDGMPEHAQTMSALQDDPLGIWAQAWVSCVARRP
ncbi:MAG: methyltransferase domain-containing protein [Betaproteobacteria bacterium]|nr:methyltransferase domain-containing protein [Betaproteobacteria bacterium]